MPQKKWDRFQLDNVHADLARTITNRLGVNWKPKHYHTSPKCKICRCPLRCEVEELLYAGVDYQDIAAWLKGQGYADIDPSAVSKHYKMHVGIEREIEERGMARYVSEVRKREGQAIAEVAKKHTGEDILDGVISLFGEREMKPEDIKVSDALKAVKIQQDSGGGSKRDPFVAVYVKMENINAQGGEPAIEGEVVEEE